MKIKSVLIVCFFSLGLLSFIQNPKNSDKEEMEQKIDSLLSKMTLEEKVGQMTQITLEVVSSRESESAELKINEEKLKEAILKYHVGSILNTGGAANSLDKWHEIITKIQDVATNESNLGIPILYGIDAIHGANYTLGATLFPQAIAMAATRNKDLVREGASITALETRASGIPWNFNPVLGMGREPLWPRFWETFGEDVHLTSEMGKAYIEGQQGDDIGDPEKVTTCIKHYVGYSVPKSGQDRTPAWIPERMLREIFLPPFEAGVKAGSMTAMVNSAEINGIPAHSDYHLLTEILKGELGFKGLIVSDWEDIKRLHDRDKVAENAKEAVKMAVLAGLDMSMVPNDYSFYDHLLELAQDGEVPMERIDDAVRRILRVKYMLRLFENPYPDESLKSKFAMEESRKANLESAREAITLLKNKNDILPLKKDQKILVTGPTANLLKVLNGGWTITWQGDNEALYPEEKFTLLEAIEDKAGKENVTYVENSGFDTTFSAEGLSKATDDADVIVLALGEPPYCETPGNIKNLELYSEQLKLAEEAYKTGKPVVLVLIEGRPRVINKIVDGADAILMAYLPGMEGGIAISDVIFGDVNPSGKLPFSYPKNVNGYTPYDYKPLESFDVNRVEPQFPFGHGLSYTDFEYSNLNLDKNSLAMNDSLQIKIDVTNTGEREGKEAVELYVADLFGSVTRPVKQLKGFEKISLQPGETKTVTFSMKTDDLSFLNRENKRVVEPGEFNVFVGGLENSFTVN